MEIMERRVERTEGVGTEAVKGEETPGVKPKKRNQGK